MTNEEFRKQAHKFADWMADYYENREDYPVKSQVKPGSIFAALPESAPDNGENIDDIFSDFKSLILPGISHWQSPNFFAYFPANTSYPSVLAEMLTAALGAQCMIWETSPAAAELEEKVMNWLKKLTGLPESWDGVIQDSASTSTLAAILSAREKYSNYSINQSGFKDHLNFRIYCSTEAHSSIEKAVKIAGFGKENLVKIPVDDQQRMQPEKLAAAVEEDLKHGYKPVCVVAALGTTSTVAIDPLEEIAAVCRQHDLWLHIDAAFAGTALLLDEYRWMIKGIEQADSFVFNPHKWMFTNFDCSAYFVKDKGALIRTFEIMPEYLKTKSDNQVNNYRDWGVPLGRRFRALKLWFVLRNFGKSGLQDKIRYHILLADELHEKIQHKSNFEILAPLSLNTICFRFHPPHILEEEKLNKLNDHLLNSINSSGKAYMTHTRIKGKFTIRMVIAQTGVTREHVMNAWDLVEKTAKTTLQELAF